MTANNPASIKWGGYLQDAPWGHTMYLMVYRATITPARAYGRGSECGLMSSRVSSEPRVSCAR
jgi:hypothetical protein